VNKLIKKYILEFAVIVLGISISFYVEKQNAIAYKNELKMESLLKLKNNLLSELEGFHFDYEIHSTANKYADILYYRGLQLYQTNKDSLGFYLSNVRNANTVFVENDEEYSALVNSGLIELIENRNLGSLLQKKYTDQKWYEKNNQLLLDLYLTDKRLDPFFESKNRRNHKGVVGYWTAYKPNKRYLNDEEINRVSETGLMHSLYSNLIKRAIIQDSLLIKEIDKELIN